MKQLFVRRDENTAGPLTIAQFKEAVANGKLVGSDQFAEASDGPWYPVAKVPFLPKPAVETAATHLGENLKLGITDRGRILLMTEHWEPGMSLDMSASHTKGPKVFDFGLNGVQQGMTFIRLKEHDGDPIEIPGFSEVDFFRFRADPLKSCDQGKEFRIDTVKFVGWPDKGKASIQQRGEYWYLKPASAALPQGSDR